MYSDVFCKVYNEFGWNYYPEAFGEQLLQWLREKNIKVRSSMDLACGTGILCRILHENGIEAAGMDFSAGMIGIASENAPHIPYDVADMITYRPQRQFDLVTCTGDALNHITDLRDVEQIFSNVYSYLHDGGYFIFDLLNENEVSTGEPFELTFSERVTALFQMLRPQETTVELRTQVYEDGQLQLEECIVETIHPPETVCRLLQQCGFSVRRCAHSLSENSGGQGMTWFVIAQK